MKFTCTIIVLLLAILGVWAMLRVSGGWNGHLLAESRGHSTVRRLLDPSALPVDELSRITLRRGDVTLRFERRGNPPHWMQVEPFEHPMDPFSIRQLAIQARETESLDVIDPDHLRGGLSLDALALDPPAAEVTYEWPGGHLTLELGRRAVAGRAYLRIKGQDAIHIVTPRLHERAIDTDHKEWRDRTIFADAGVNSSRIHWQAGEYRLTLEQQRKQWMMTEPSRTRLDEASRDAYMQAIGRAVIAGFILDQPTQADLARFGLAEPAARISVVNGPERSQTLFIGARAGGGTMDHFGMIEGRPVVVRLSGAVIAAMLRQPPDLAAMTASGAVPADVKSIVIRSADGEVRLERELEKWRGVTGAASAAGDDSPSPREINAAHANQLLEQLTSLRATSVEFAPYPRELEVATITLHGFEGRALDTVRIVQEKETGRWGMENGDNVIRIYPAGLNLRLKPPDFGL
jgi:hypothetical protein